MIFRFGRFLFFAYKLTLNEWKQKSERLGWKKHLLLLDGHLSNRWREAGTAYSTEPRTPHHSVSRGAAHHRLQALGKLVCFYRRSFCLWFVLCQLVVPVIYSLFYWNPEKRKQPIILQNYLSNRKTHLQF